MNSRVAAIAAFTLVFSFAALAQVPPPPPAPGQQELTRSLIAEFKANDVQGYARLLSDEVHVYEDGALVARDKKEWIKRLGPMLAAKGVTFELSPGYSSTNHLLFIEYFNSMASWGRTPPPDCCWGYSAVSYDINHGKIVTIRKLTGGAIRLDENGNSR